MIFDTYFTANCRKIVCQCFVYILRDIGDGFCEKLEVAEKVKIFHYRVIKILYD